MAAPVWVLSVDLQAKTATFATGMADAAKNARGAFQDIKTGAGEAGKEVGGSMSEARHGVMLLGEEFGVHIPRALTTFISSIGPIGAAMEAAFPFLAIVVGATLLLEHLAKLREAGEKLTEAQEKFATATYNAFDSLDQKLLEAGIRSDELRENHLGALHKELELIDKQSLADLVHQFDIVGKAADAVFAELKSHWYTLGVGSSGAQNALNKFKSEYELLLAQGKDQEASDLLRGTRESAQKALALMHEVQEAQGSAASFAFKGPNDAAKLDAAGKELNARTGITALTKQELDAQETLVQALNAQVTVEEKVAALKKAQQSNAVLGAAKKAEPQQREDWDRAIDAQQQALAREQKAQEDAHTLAVAELQQTERDKVVATQQGSQARLAAINAAIKEEEQYGLQETSFYRSLLTDRVNLVRQISEDQARVQADAGKIEADHAQAMAELQLAADRQQGQLRLSTLADTEKEWLSQETFFADQEFTIQKTALDQQIQALDKFDKSYENKLKALQNKETELVKSHENQITAIRNKAEEDRNRLILSAELQLNNSIAGGLASSILQHQTWGSMVLSLMDQVATGMIENAVRAILADDMTKPRDAAKAARSAFLNAQYLPPPLNLIMPPIFAAGAFAAVMAFEGGGIVPGVGRGDTVPAMLTPGEAILPRSLTESLTSAARGGGFGGPRGEIHYHAHFAPHIQAIDSAGVDTMLRKHADTFHRHLQQQLRKMNV